MSGEDMDEMLGNIRQENGSAAAGQEHSSQSSSFSSELINNQQGDQPLSIPRSEVGNSCVNNNPSSLEDEEEAAVAVATEQPQMDIVAAQAQQLCDNQGGHSNMMSLNLNQDLNSNLWDHQQEISSDTQLHHHHHAPSSQTLFGFDLTRSAIAENTTNNGAGGDEAHIYHAAHQQPHQLIQPHEFIGLPNNNNAAGSGYNNGVVLSQFNGTPSRAQVIGQQAAAMLPTHEIYAPGDDQAPPSQFHQQQLLPPQHHQMQVTLPETMASQQPDWPHHLHYGLQHPTRRLPPTLVYRRRNLTNSLYDPYYEYSGLPVDPILRMFVCNPSFANRRRD